jgi:diadenylate cyclase
LSVRTWLEGLDLLLVIVTFYLFLHWIQRRQAAFLLRGALVLGVVLFIITTILPLPTFDWIIRGALLIVLITLPVIFQPELRRLLERVGRNAGVPWAVRRTAAESTLSDLAKTVERLAVNQTGALFVLQGGDSLRHIIETGVPIGAQVTEDLLQAIFYGKNPLHDGALVLREDQIVAASCVLPLTDQPLIVPGRRLGTRHRAAVGLSETTDALVVIVSEETGEISIAQGGTLFMPLTITALRERLYDFYLPANASNGLSFQGFTRRLIENMGQFRLPTFQGFVSNIGLFFLAALLALALWSFVISQTNPARRVLVEDISLRVENTPPGMILMGRAPESVSALIQTTDNVVATLRPSAFQATVSLAGLPPGLHQLGVVVNSSLSQVRILSVDPAALNLELAPIISRTVPVSIELANQQNISPAFQIVRVPIATPNKVEVTGPAPLVEQVSQVRATISLANVSASLQELRPVVAIDEAGREVTGLTLQPGQVQVAVTIQQRLNALDVGVRAVTENAPPAGYWLSDLRVNPASLTLQGNPSELVELESYVNTLPVDISNATGDLTVQIPLDLPSSIQAIDSNGDSVKTVTVVARITPLRGDLVVTRPVELTGPNQRARVSVDPPEVLLLLSGPLPTLNEIEKNPELVQVIIDTASLTTGPNIDVTPVILTPEGIQAKSVPPTVKINLPAP